MRQEGGFIRSLFSNDEGELRSGWRALAFFSIFIVISLVLTSIAGLVMALIPSLAPYLTQLPLPTAPASGAALAFNAITWTAQLGAALIASAICARALERRGFGSVGFKLHKGWLRDFAFGSAGGGATLVLAVAASAAVGAMGFSVQISEPLILARNFLALFVTFLIAAASEELLLRGFPFQALTHNIGPVGALSITSVAFGLLHYLNPNVTLLSTFNTVLAGVWLGTAYLMTRSLWLATALHYSWNLVMVFVFGLPVSGITMYSHLAWLRSEPGEPAWISGGSYGPEGGLAATLALVISTLFIWKSGLFSPSQEMIETTRHGSTSRSEVPRADPVW